MSPEQAKGDPMDARSDLFSLGSVLYTMCTGRPAFRADNPVAVLRRVCDDTPRPIHEVNAELPQWLEAIVNKLLAKSPNDRFQSASEVAELLSKYLAHVQNPAQVPAPEEVELTYGAVASSDSDTAEASNWQLPLGLRIGLVALIVFLVRSIPDWRIQWSIVGLLLFWLLFEFIRTFADAYWKGSRRIEKTQSHARSERQSHARQFVIEHPVLGLFAMVLLLTSVATATYLITAAAGRRAAKSHTSAAEAPADTSPAAFARYHFAKLQGTWTAISAEAGGQPISGHDLTNLRLVFDGDHVTAKGPGPNGGGEGTFELETAATPRRIKITRQEGRNRFAIMDGIYDLDGDRLKICMGEPAENISEFKSRPGTSILLAEFVRLLSAKEIEGTPRATAGSLKNLPQSASASEVVDLATWGHFVDPKSDCRLDRKTDSITIAVPGGPPHNLLPLAGYNHDAPRLIGDVEGDFTIEVRVPPYQLSKSGTAARNNGVSYRSAGLLVWIDDDDLLRFERSSFGERGDGAPFLHLEWFRDGGHFGDEFENVNSAPDRPSHLKIDRRGGELQLSKSDDGQTWMHWKTVRNLKLPPRVSLGVMVQNSTTEDFAASFEALKIGVNLPNAAAVFKSAPGVTAGSSSSPTTTANALPHVSWGEIVDPLGDCRFTEADGRLTITVPGDRNHNLNPLPGYNLNAPRALREVEGDFEARVTVLPHPLPQAMASTSPSIPYVGAGLIVWQDETHFLRLLRSWMPTANTFVHPEWFGEGAAPSEKTPSVPDRPTHLRIRRTGDRLELAISADGQTWTEVTTTDLPLAVRVRVGVAVVNSVNYEFTARFEGFAVRPSANDAPPPAVAPFDATQAKTHQEDWAKHLGVPVELTNSIGMKLRLVPPGEFFMGSSEGEIEPLVVQAYKWHEKDLRSETPQRLAEIPAPYYLGQFEVTVAQFRKFVEDTGYKTTAETNGKGGSTIVNGQNAFRPDLNWRHPEVALSDDHPVVEIDLKDANEFCAWLSKKDGRTYVVPDEKHWEFACRAGSTSPWFGRLDALGDYAWIFDNFGGQTHTVGLKLPNAFGLYDMLGNVDELCPADDGGVVGRGGMANNNFINSRCAARRRLEGDVNFRRGFRVAILDPRP
jgi:uncharacterized protein (TIGR03067 family)